ncbi:MAG: hypothetical protein ABIG92_02200 [Candidatus Omnitrophota bacterium]
MTVFNHKLSSYAIIWLIIIITSAEVILSFILPSKLFDGNETDEALYNIEHVASNIDFVLLGDSVGRQILKESYNIDKKGYLTLATNKGTEMVGQYYLAKRYLLKNKKPKAMIFVGNNPFDDDLSGIYTENYFQRCFLKFDEIAELVPYKDIKFCFVMMIYKIFPSYRYRLHIRAYMQKHLFCSNSKVFDITTEKKGKELEGKVHFQSSLFKHKKTALISDIYFRKLLNMLKQKSIRFYFVDAPKTESYFKQEENIKSYENMFKYLGELEDEYENFYFLKSLGTYPDEYFKNDSIHLIKELPDSKLPVAAYEFQRKMDQIEKDLM